MGINEIREKYLKEECKEEGIKEAISKLLFKGKNVDEIVDLLNVSIEIVNEVKSNM